MKSMLLFLVLAFISVPVAVLSAPEVQLPTGRVQGVDKLAEVTNNPYYAYYAIPFAEPPVGSLRFEPPRPFAGSNPNDVISKPQFGPACIQFMYNKPMSEDCLQLNIFVPPSALPVTGGQPLKKVMFFIHGGAYVIGAAVQYTPSRLVTDYDVIVVTTNYRLNIFGFASTMDSALPGNNGFKDQILALKWVRDNIRDFGGDSSDITIFGESAGSASVSALSLSPLAKGLFTKGIMQSGVTNAYFAIDRIPVDRLYEVARKVDCVPYWYLPGMSVKYHENMVNCLKTKSANDLNVPPSFAVPDKFEISEYTDFAPVVDGEVLPKHPMDMIYDQEYLRQVGTLDRTYIVGTTNSEGLSSVNMFFPTKDSLTLGNVTLFIDSALKSVAPIITNPTVKELLYFQYAYPREVTGEPSFQGLMDMITDTTFLVPSVEFARLISKASATTNIFFYLFDHYPKLKDPNSPLKGTDHALDLLYLFDYDEAFEPLLGYVDIPSPSTEPVFDVYAGAFTTFAKTGNPSRSLTWPRFESPTELYMAIGNVPEVRQRVAARRVALWTEFIPTLPRH